MVVFVRVLVDKVHLPLVERELRRVELWHFGCVAAKRRARRANVAVVPEGRAAQVADQAPRPAARVGRVWVPAKVVTAETSVWPAFDRVPDTRNSTAFCYNQKMDVGRGEARDAFMDVMSTAGSRPSLAEWKLASGKS
eukprot:459374-Pleurochrysis_carterae.AAC.2